MARETSKNKNEEHELKLTRRDKNKINKRNRYIERAIIASYVANRASKQAQAQRRVNESIADFMVYNIPKR